MPAPLPFKRPPGATRTVPTAIRVMAGELSVAASRAAAVLDRAWAHDTAIDRLNDELIDLAERALMLRRHLADWRKREEERAAGEKSPG